MLLTPVLRGTDARLHLTISEADFKAMPRGATRPGTTLGTVTDTATGKRYRITSKACGLGCVCDAWARELKAEAA